MAKWIMQEFSVAERGMEILQVRPGESLPREQALSAISGRPPGAHTSEQDRWHVWHWGLAKAAWTNQSCGVTAGLTSGCAM